MTKKGYSRLPRSPKQKPHHQMQFSAIPRLHLLFFRVLLLYSRLPRSPKQKPHHQMQFSAIPRLHLLFLGSYSCTVGTINIFWTPGVKTKLYRRKILIVETELHSQNRIEVINALAVQVVKYNFNVINWNLTDIQPIDTKARKLLTANKMHYPLANIDILYLPIKVRR